MENQAKKVSFEVTREELETIYYALNSERWRKVSAGQPDQAEAKLHRRVEEVLVKKFGLDPIEDL